MRSALKAPQVWSIHQGRERGRTCGGVYCSKERAVLTGPEETRDTEETRPPQPVQAELYLEDRGLN